MKQILLILFAVALAHPAWAASSEYCGVSGDKAIHQPTDYDTFAPPAVGGSYTDPNYGCVITRLTDAIHRTGSQACSNATCQGRLFYSLVAPSNINDTLVHVVLDGSAAIIVGPAGNYGNPGDIAVTQKNFPSLDMTSTDFVAWDTVSPSTFYYTAKNTFKMGQVTGLPGCVSTHSCTIKSTTLGTNSSYTAISLMAAARPSLDGVNFWVAGHSGSSINDAGCDNSAERCDIFDVTINAAGGAATSATFGRPVVTNAYWHKLQMATNNRFQLEALNGTDEFTEYNSDGSFYARLLTGSHHDFSFYTDGATEAMVDSWSPGSRANVCPHNRGAGVVFTSDAAMHNCLLEAFLPSTNGYGIPPGIAPATHISQIGNTGYALISISSYGQGVCPNAENPYCEQGSSATTNMRNWGLYDGEIILAKLDGTDFRRLAFHRSRTGAGYWAAVNGTIGLSGKYVYFASNYNSCPTSEGCGSQTNTQNRNYVDLYALKLIPGEQ